MKITDRIWIISLFAVATATIVLGVLRIVGVYVPDIVARITGLIDLLAICGLVYATVKKVKQNRAEADSARNPDENE